tara:strand:- start:5448 stop:5984 length:537 start_codon:yes stop_codon:yes gene_type:complete
MAALTNQPKNLNFLSPLKFDFVVNKLPNVNFFVQSVLLPAVTMGTVELPSPFVKLPNPGTHIDFTEFQISFAVDENMSSYLELYDWILALGFPDNFDQYKQLADNDNRRNVLGTDGIMSDATLIIHNSASQPNLKVKFKGMFPSTLSELSFDLRNGDVSYIECICSFRYESFTLELIK